MIAHFFNFGNYYQKNPIFDLFFSALIESLKDCDMTFKVWTEDDKEIEKWANESRYCSEWASTRENGQFKKFEYIKLKVLYKYGGFICEPDIIIYQSMKEFFEKSTFQKSPKNGWQSWSPIWCEKEREDIKYIIEKFDDSVGKLKSDNIFLNSEEFESNDSLSIEEMVLLDKQNLDNESVVRYIEAKNPKYKWRNLSIDYQHIDIRFMIRPSTPQQPRYVVAYDDKVLVYTTLNYTHTLYIRDLRTLYFIIYHIIKSFELGTLDRDDKNNKFSPLFKFYIDNYKSADDFLKSEEVQKEITYRFPKNNIIS